MKIMAIAPYEGLKKLMIDIGKNEEFELQVEVGDLEKGVELAREALVNNTDVIISRGGTAELIQKEVSIPVIEIEISGYDMLRVLTLLRDYPGKVAIVGFASISVGAATVCEILNTDISSYTIKEEPEVEPMLIKLKQEGYQAIIGDFITVKKAENMGLNGVLLTSGKESVLKAFRNAQKVYEYAIKIKRELSIAKKIIEAENCGIIVYDRELKLIYSNIFLDKKISKFKDMLKLENSVGEVLENGKFQLISCVENEYWKVTGNSIEDGSLFAVFRIEKCKLNYHKDTPGVFIITFNKNRLVNVTNMMVTKNEKMKNALKMAEEYFNIDKSIWINGEKGTGKEKLARYIYFNSSNKLKPLLILDCNIISDENWDSILTVKSDSTSIFASEIGMIFLKNIDTLAIPIQKQLMDYLLKNKHKCRFIASSEENILNLIELGKFQHELYYFLSNLTLQIPSLRNRKEDIENLAHIYINEFNAKFGRQIVGIREDAKEILKNFQWHGNIDQFKQALGEIVLKASDPYIGNTDVEKVLKQIKTPIEKLNIDLTGSLEEIEQRIIKQVWIEEGMNNTHTANRLKITRTTLWRKLK